ncbi:hypothetical protein SLEP1_g56121 [Rubroshorea leprosula]|uniref:Reverse transcriptase domain-containing protein n=1 Tax=Rubroshorea leprosula TaxID=152421 RepID=A0AAV5MHJ9_9ROSI|nr:hypothetical protein SLEP1_g56121 [Rubroshorea leprosula]
MYHPKCAKVQLTHLCFADDLIIFTDGASSSLSAINNVLTQFYQLSGLKVNYSKSEIFCCGISSEEIKKLTAAYGFKAGVLPVRYLGVPLITGKLTEKDLKPLVSKITERMSSWASKHLSFAGRLQLISFVIQGITTFWCSTFILPKKVIKEVERLCAAFLWQSSTESARGAKVNWLSLCHPKQEGGLGLRSLTHWNVTCIMRFIWMLFTKAGSIWVAWVHEYLLKGCSFWSIRVPSDASWGWRKLLNLRQQARKLIKHIPGDGKDIYLWHDNWHPSGPLVENFGARIVQDSGFSSQAKLEVVVNGNFWKWPPARSPQLLDIQIALCDKLYPKERDQDTVIWIPSASRTYTAGRTWHWIRSKQSKVPWHRLVWFSRQIPKHSFISWLAILDRLTTKARQKKWSPNIDDTCVLCNNGSETVEHLFFKCSYAKCVWKSLSAMSEIPYLESWQQLVLWMGKRIRRKSLYQTLIKLMWNAAVYHFGRILVPIVGAVGLCWRWLRIVNGAMVVIAMTMVQSFRWGLCDNGLREWWVMFGSQDGEQETCGMIASSKKVRLCAEV